MEMAHALINNLYIYIHMYILYIYVYIIYIHIYVYVICYLMLKFPGTTAQAHQVSISFLASSLPQCPPSLNQPAPPFRRQKLDWPLREE